MNGLRWYGLIAALAVAAGCTSSLRYTPDQEARYVKAVIAVEPFACRVPVPSSWNVGAGMADGLARRLVSTRRYMLPETSAGGTSRPVRYRIDGTVTDFCTHVSPSGRDEKPMAMVAIIVRVIDTRTGQVVVDKLLVSTAAGKEDVSTIPGMTFDSYAFTQTPLGRAANEALDQAAGVVVGVTDQEPWQGRIAEVRDDGAIIINGGKDRWIIAGMTYQVRQTPTAVIDPVSGVALGDEPGAVIGTILITRVLDHYAIAEVLDGTSGYAVGQVLERCAMDPAKKR